MFVQLLIVASFTMFIHASETLAYTIRLAGIRSGKMAVALSLTGIVVLVSRTLNMMQGPLLGGLVDHALKFPEFDLTRRLHFILGAASIGTLAAILVAPTFISLATRMIAQFESTGSIPQLLRTSVTIDKLRKVPRHVRKPRWDMLSRLRIGGIPKRLLLLNCAATAIYTVGVLAALYASVLIPDEQTQASQSSGLINGLATILLTVLIDPQVALLSDKTARGEAKPEAINKMFGLLMLSRFAGTLLAQLLLEPAAHWIKWIVSVI